jgi:nitroreductase
VFDPGGKSAGALATSVRAFLEPYRLRPLSEKRATLRVRDRDHASIDDVIRSRTSTRKFRTEPVGEELVREILDAARHAPSGANIQPWRVYVVSGEIQHKIGSALLLAHETEKDSYASEYAYYAEELPEPYLSRKKDFGRIFYGSLGIEQADMTGRARQTGKNYGFFGAPVGLIVTIDRRLEQGSWLDLGMFLQNIMLSAKGRGLSSCPQETFAKYHKLLRTLLPIADAEMVVCGISMGFEEDGNAIEPRLMPRAPVDEFACFLGFN